MKTSLGVSLWSAIVVLTGACSAEDNSGRTDAVTNGDNPNSPADMNAGQDDDMLDGVDPAPADDVMPNDDDTASPMPEDSDAEPMAVDDVDPPMDDDSPEDPPAAPTPHGELSGIIAVAPSTVNSRGVMDVAATPDGGVAVVGTAEGLIDFGGGEVELVGNSVDRAAFLVKYDDDQQYVWGSALPLSNLIQPSEIAATKDGGIVLVGSYNGELALGPGFSTEDHDAFVAAFTADGQVDFVQPFGAEGQQNGQCLALGDDGSVYFGGYYNMPFQIGDVTHDALNTENNGTGSFYVAKLDPSGAPMWSRSFEGWGGNTYPMEMVVDGASLLVAGFYVDALESGDVHLEGGGYINPHLFRLDAETGAILDSFGGGSSDTLYYDHVLVDSTGAVYLGIYMSGTTTFGDTTVTWEGKQSSLGGILKLTPDFEVDWFHAFDDTEGMFAGEMALGANDELYVSGRTLVSQMSTGYLLTMTPDGERLGEPMLLGTTVSDVDVHGSTIWLGGSAQTGVLIGNTPVSADISGFLAKVATRQLVPMSAGIEKR